MQTAGWMNLSRCAARRGGSCFNSGVAEAFTGCEDYAVN